MQSDDIPAENSEEKASKEKKVKKKSHIPYDQYRRITGIIALFMKQQVFFFIYIINAFIYLFFCLFFRLFLYVFLRAHTYTAAKLCIKILNPRPPSHTHKNLVGYWARVHRHTMG